MAAHQTTPCFGSSVRLLAYHFYQGQDLVGGISRDIAIRVMALPGLAFWVVELLLSLIGCPQRSSVATAHLVSAAIESYTTPKTNLFWATNHLQQHQQQRDAAARWPPAGLWEVGRGNDRAPNVQRAAQRRPLVANHQATGSEQSYLEATRVGEDSNWGYRRRCLYMLTWIQFHDLAFWTVGQIDAALTAFLDELFACGDHVSEAQKCIAGFVFFFPNVAGKSGDLLIRTKRALKSWSQKDKPRAKTPLLWEGACAIAVVLSSWGFVDLAVWVLAMYDTFARPTEGLLCRLADVVMPSWPNFPSAGVN